MNRVWNCIFFYSFLPTMPSRLLPYTKSRNYCGGAEQFLKNKKQTSGAHYRVSHTVPHNIIFSCLGLGPLVHGQTEKKQKTPPDILFRAVTLNRNENILFFIPPRFPLFPFSPFPKETYVCAFSNEAAPLVLVPIVLFSDMVTMCPFFGITVCPSYAKSM